VSPGADEGAPGSGRKRLTWSEREPGRTAGRNDEPRTAEAIQAFGTGSNRVNRLRVAGHLADRGRGADRRPIPPAPEDNGSIPTAVRTGLGAPGTVTTTGVLGDGPHGPAGDGTNDFDFYAVDVPAGTQLVADTSGSAEEAAAGVVVYDAGGRQLAFGTDPGSTPGSTRLVVTPPKAGRHYVMVGGAATPSPFPADPFDSGSGAGEAATGAYALSISVRPSDTDQYAVRLRPGDVLGVVAKGSADTIRVRDPRGREVVGTTGGDFSPLYPPESPLPGGGNATLAHVAAHRGWYVVSADGSHGDYRLEVEAYRPSLEGAAQPPTVLLDFDGGRVDTRPLHGPGVRRLSPFSAFIEGWHLPASREGAMVRAITREVRAALVTEVRKHGPAHQPRVRVVSSRSHPELRRADDVTHVVIGGTIAESGVATIGTSSSVDPGNFGHDDVALVLLDLLSAPAGSRSSLNTYMDAGSDREAFVAQGIGNVAAHEVAHTLGSYHTDNRVIDELMDSAGTSGFAAIYGVGPDGVGGTDDDVNLKLGQGRYAQTEGFTGVQDTANVTAWAWGGPS
jgi:hypothetical protein